jgi:UDP:flavonoid glycosyltransferase YjiC (YdhE family)
MGSMHGLVGARFEVFADTPRWFFDESVAGLYRYHQVVTDVGLRQLSALAFDGRSTLEALNSFLPFDEALVERLARTVRETSCRAVICDISPLGVAVARRAGVPSVLVENFTWPWLYEPLFGVLPAIRAHAEMISGWLSQATHHVQTEPVCDRFPGVDLYAKPMSRPPRSTRSAVRASMGVASDEPIVVITMGGVPEPLPFLPSLRALDDVTFIVTGASETGVDGNVHLFDSQTRVYMPDLIRGADAVVAKAGYSTVAEVWAEGRPLAFVTRSDFRETAALRSWISREMVGFEIPGEDFAAGAWIDRMPELLGTPQPLSRAENGADAVAGYLVEALELGGPG